MRFLVHCNSGGSTGLGHAMRSLALVEEAVSRGHSVAVTGSLQGAFEQAMLADAGATMMSMPVSGARDVWRPDLVHLDSYESVDAVKGVLISNLSDGEYGLRTADISIDPSLGAELTDPHVSSARDLRGVAYAPVRSAVRRAKDEWAFRDECRRVLVVSGGTDTTASVQQIAEGLSAELPNTVHIVGVTQNLPATIRPRPNVELIPTTPNLPHLASTCDLVVTAAGTSVVDFCCIGIPMVVIPVADNQLANFQRLVHAGAAVGDQTLDPSQVAGHVAHLVQTPDARRALSATAQELVDGWGARRIVEAWERAVHDAAG